VKHSNKLLVVVAALGVVALGSRAAWAVHQEQETERRLVRLLPGDDDDPVVVELRVEQEEFDAATWAARLQDADLGVREQHFDQLVRRARHDAAAREWLRREVAEGAVPELAWTARLALRELDRSGVGRRLHWTFGQRDGDAPGHAWLRTRPRVLHEKLEELLPGLGIEVAPGDAGPLVWAFPDLPEGSVRSSQKGIQIERGAFGVRVQVTTQEEDGESTTRTFEAPTMEALLEANPDLAKELGKGELGLDQGLRIELGGPGAGLFGQDWQRFFVEPGLELRPEGNTLRFHFEGDQHRPVKTDILGVRVEALRAEDAAELGLAAGTGLYVHHALPGTIAQLLGLSGGDVLLSLNGRELRQVQDITSVMDQRPEGGALVARWVDAEGRERSATWQPEPAPHEHEHEQAPRAPDRLERVTPQ
jgi:hypothetical protein